MYTRLLADSVAMSLPRSFAIRESSHRILDPFTPDKLATLGAALRLSPWATMIDLACGKGETLCTWARDHQITGVGVDLNPPFIEAADQRAVELGVADRVEFVLADASAYVAAEPVDVASCCGATWIGGGVTGTLELLARSLRPGGIALIGEPFWRVDPPDQAAVEGSYAQHRDDFRSLPGLIEEVGAAGWELVEMVLADQDSWEPLRRRAVAQPAHLGRRPPRRRPGRRAPRGAPHRAGPLRPLPARVPGVGDLRPDAALTARAGTTGQAVSRPRGPGPPPR